MRAPRGAVRLDVTLSAIRSANSRLEVEALAGLRRAFDKGAKRVGVGGVIAADRVFEIPRAGTGLETVYSEHLVRPGGLVGRQVNRPGSDPGHLLRQSQQLVPLARQPRDPISLQAIQPQDQGLHHASGHGLEPSRLAFAERRAGLSIDHAQGSQSIALRRDQGRAGVETDVWRTRHQRVVTKPLVGGGVRHHADRVRTNGVLAE